MSTQGLLQRLSHFTVRLAIIFSVILLVFIPRSVGAATAKLDAIAAADYLSPLEKEVVREINLARQDPRHYAAFLEETRPYYHGNRFERPGETAIITQEGVKAVAEAIAFLRQAKPLPPLRPSRGLSLAAREQLEYLKWRSRIGHGGRGGSRVWDRASRYGQWSGSVGENIAIGPGQVRPMVMQFIVDDGVADRSHRTNLFRPHYRVGGIACLLRPPYRTLCVMTFANAYDEQPPADPPTSWLGALFGRLTTASVDRAQ